MITKSSMTSTLTEGPHRLILNIEGDEKTGKNHFAFSGQWPLAYFNIGERDNSRLLKHWSKIKKCPPLFGHYIIPTEDILRVKDMKTIQANADQARVEWKRFLADYMAILRDPKIRTMVIDNGKNLKTLIELCKFGKLVGNIDPSMKAQANLDFLNVIYRARATTKNLFLLHRLGPEWKPTKKADGKAGFPEQTGEKVPVCFKDVPFEVDASVRTERNQKSGVYSITIRDCGIGFEGGGLKGERFTDEECRFRFVAAKLWGDEPKDWK